MGLLSHLFLILQALQPLDQELLRKKQKEGEEHRKD
jgi:hypothetical protein